MKSRTISFYTILLLLVLVPTITVSISLSIVMYNMTSREIRDSMNNSMVSYITEMGIAYDNTTETAKTINENICIQSGCDKLSEKSG